MRHSLTPISSDRATPRAGFVIVLGLILLL